MSRVRHWLSDRLGVAEVAGRLGRLQVSGGDPTYYLAGALVFLFLLEVASGILLLLPYWPDPSHAHDSVLTIVGRVPFGTLVRGVHAWTSDLLVLTLIAQPVVLLFKRRYRRPGELVWLSAFVLLGFGVGLAFTGAILPWNQSAYAQALVSSDLAGHVPFFGTGLKEFLRGGPGVGKWTLHHAFSFHTGVLPAMATLSLGVYFLLLVRLVRRHEAESDGSPTIVIYPDLTVRVAAVCVFLLVIILSLATFVEPSVGVAANLTAPMAAGARPPWYFVFVHQLVEALPPQLLGVDSPSFVVGGLMLLGLVTAALPFLDPRGSRVAVYIGALVLAFYLWLTVYALV